MQERKGQAIGENRKTKKMTRCGQLTSETRTKSADREHPGAALSATGIILYRIWPLSDDQVARMPKWLRHPTPMCA